MRLLRAIFVLAIVAALWGAPSSVSAAVNELGSPQVSPATGSVTTVFTFRVRYEGGFPATSVAVIAAGRTVPMALESGSSTAGWWAASTLLPSGAWSTSFRATATQGPAATVGGPVVIVAGLATPSPTATGAAPPSSGATRESAPADGLDGRTAPPAAPAPPPEEAAATATPVATAAPAAPGQDPEPGGSGGSGTPSEGGPVATPAPGGGSSAGGGGGGSAEPAGEGAPAASPITTPAPGGDRAVVQPTSDTEQRDDQAAIDGVVSDVLLIGLAGVASVAIIGSLLLIAGRRREPARATVSPAAGAGDDALLRRGALSSRAQPGDDPIVAALGVDEEMAARRAIRRAIRQNRDERSTRRPRKR
jgi:hypothetical protein